MPIMEYPPVPLCTISNTEKHSMQSVINKALRFIYNREDENSRAEELHMKHITPLNIRIATQAKQIWETIRTIEPEQYNNLTQLRNREHKWFPKSSTIIFENTIQAIITRQQQIDVHL